MERSRYEVEILLVEDNPSDAELSWHGLRCLGRMEFPFRKLFFLALHCPLPSLPEPSLWAGHGDSCAEGKLRLPIVFARPQSAIEPGGFPWNF